MKTEYHMAVSVPVAAGVWYFTGSWIYFLLALFLGVFVDSDHVFDYIREEKKFDFKDMFIKSYKGDFNKLYLFFHCFEFIPLAWVAGYFMNNWVFPAVFTVAYLSHMIPDQFTNNIRPFGYFFIFRAVKGFDMKKIFYFPRK